MEIPVTNKFGMSFEKAPHGSFIMRLDEPWDEIPMGEYVVIPRAEYDYFMEKLDCVISAAENVLKIAEGKDGRKC